MTLVGVLKFVGWVFAITPLVIFVAVSGFMLWGAGNDDGVIMALNMLAITFFVMGVIILLLVYLTGIFDTGTVFALLS